MEYEVAWAVRRPVNTIIHWGGFSRFAERSPPQLTPTPDFGAPASRALETAVRTSHEHSYPLPTTTHRTHPTPPPDIKNVQQRCPLLLFHINQNQPQPFPFHALSRQPTDPATCDVPRMAPSSPFTSSSTSLHSRYARRPSSVHRSMWGDRLNHDGTYYSCFCDVLHYDLYRCAISTCQPKKQSIYAP